MIVKFQVVEKEMLPEIILWAQENQCLVDQDSVLVDAATIMQFLGLYGWAVNYVYTK